MEISREELEEIVDKKVEKRLTQQETARSEPEAQGKTAEKESDSSLSRRNFLKALGGGAAGLGAAAMIPSAAGLRINADQGLSYYNSSSANKSQFEVGPNGILNAQQIGTDKNPVGSIHSETTNTEELSANSIDADELSHSRFIFVGPNGKFDSLSSAFNNITNATADNRYLLWVTDDIADTSQVTPKPHIDVHFNSHTISVDLSNSVPAVRFEDVVDSEWVNGEVIASGSTSKAAHFGGVTDNSVGLDNIRFEGGGQQSGGNPAVSVNGSDTDPQFTGCEFVQGDNPDGAGAFTTNNGATPVLQSCRAYGGNGKDKEDGYRVTDSSPVFEGCYALAGRSDSSNVHAFHILDDSSPKKQVVWGKGANGTTNSSDGLEVERGATPKIAGSTFRGADDDGATGSSASRAGIIASGSDGEYNGCSFVGGAGNGSAGALQVNTGSDPKMVGCTFVPGDKSDSQNAWGLLVRENAGGEYINCLSTYRTRGMQEYDVVGDSSFVPIAGEPYIILNISVKVDVADSGATLNIGTTDGGAEIYCLS